MSKRKGFEGIPKYLGEEDGEKVIQQHAQLWGKINDTLNKVEINIGSSNALQGFMEEIHELDLKSDRISPIPHPDAIDFEELEDLHFRLLDLLDSSSDPDSLDFEK